ncbi:MAG: hypothetical protein ACJ758_03055 [Actinomycetota bacterium]
MTRNILCVVAVALVSCSAHQVDSGPFAEVRPPTLGAGAVPHTASTLTDLNEDRVTTGALEAARLTALLGSAGYLAGTERSFVSNSSPLDRAATRVLAFEHDGGAAEYLRWVQDHPGDLIGDAEPSKRSGQDGGPSVYVHTPNGCCAKDIPKTLAVWQRDRYVLEVIANGSYAKDKMVRELSTEMDRLV